MKAVFQHFWNYLFSSKKQKSGHPNTRRLALEEDKIVTTTVFGIDHTNTIVNTTSVDVKIIDDDHWKVKLTHANVKIKGMELAWEFRVNGNNNDIRNVAGISENPLYVTRTAPQAQSSGNLYHTVVHVGCVAAKGQPNEDTAFSAIWGKLESLNIYSVKVASGAVVDNEDVMASSVSTLKVKTTIQGQGGVIPRENTWSGHALIGYNDCIFDPSYGISYGTTNVAAQAFINNLDRIGNIKQSTGTAVATAGYGFIYTPTKNTAGISAINKRDLEFSWLP